MRHSALNSGLIKYKQRGRQNWQLLPAVRQPWSVLRSVDARCNIAARINESSAESLAQSGAWDCTRMRTMRIRRAVIDSSGYGMAWTHQMHPQTLAFGRHPPPPILVLPITPFPLPPCQHSCVSQSRVTRNDPAFMFIPNPNTLSPLLRLSLFCGLACQSARSRRKSPPETQTLPRGVRPSILPLAFSLFSSLCELQGVCVCVCVCVCVKS